MVKATQIQDFQDIPEHLNFLGLGKAARERRVANKQKRIDSRIEIRALNAENRNILAKKGIDGSFGGNFGKAFAGILQSAGGLFGGGKIGGMLGGGESEQTIGNNGVVQEPKDNTVLYIGLGIGFVAVVGLIVWAVKR